MFFKFSKFVFLLTIIVCVVLLMLIGASIKKVEVREDSIRNKELQWYFTEGSIWPDDVNNSIWPNQLGEDRIHEQLMITSGIEPSAMKTIYLKRREFNVPLGDSVFKDLMCPVNQCSIVKTRENADAVIFKDSVDINRKSVSQDQIWILYVLESPVYSGYDHSQNPSVNWTATYREDSDIVTPYGKWMLYDKNVEENSKIPNYAAGKTKQVAWFVSNCLANNKRLEYAKELQQYIEVDIYGNCGDHQCDKSQKDCNEILRNDYKFYLSFENSNCRDYITEKFFDNALGNNIIPIVMGAHPDDYKRVAPKYSYIHVDDFPTTRDLADYLDVLNANDDLYNAYFAWQGTGEFINTRFFCRLCALLHSPSTPNFYPDFRAWWAAPNVCRSDGWMK